MTVKNKRVVSGMRPTGAIHLGNYHGALKNWVSLQYQYDCYFFVTDWHALTTHYDRSNSNKNSNKNIENQTWAMLRDWLAAGLDPNACKIFIQSSIKEHAELSLLLSMLTPLSWLYRVPTYKDQQAKLKEHDLSTYGFLGYPVLQSADVLVYKGDLVPVGFDQLAHIEIIRAIAKRFNYIYGQGNDFNQMVEQCLKKMNKKNLKIFKQLAKKYKEHGDHAALQQGQALLLSESKDNQLTIADQEYLNGFLNGTGKTILPEPTALLSEVSKFPGLDGNKMSKSYNNTIGLTEEPELIIRKIKTMPTDPARRRRSDPGDPEKCPVWDLHKIYSSQEVKNWVEIGCKNAGIGCLECKGPVIDSILKEQKPILERAEAYTDLSKVKAIVETSAEQARTVAQATLSEVREAIGIANL